MLLPSMLSGEAVAHSSGKEGLTRRHLVQEGFALCFYPPVWYYTSIQLLSINALDVRGLLGDFLI